MNTPTRLSRAASRSARPPAWTSFQNAQSAPRMVRRRRRPVFVFGRNFTSMDRRSRTAAAGSSRCFSPLSRYTNYTHRFKASGRERATDAVWAGHVAVGRRTDPWQTPCCGHSCYCNSTQMGYSYRVTMGDILMEFRHSIVFRCQPARILAP